MTTTHWLQLIGGLLLMSLGTWAAAFRLRLGRNQRPKQPQFRHPGRPVVIEPPVSLVQEINRLPRWLWLGVSAVAIAGGLTLTAQTLLEQPPTEFSTNFPYTELAVPVQRPGSS